MCQGDTMACAPVQQSLASKLACNQKCAPPTRPLGTKGGTIQVRVLHSDYPKALGARDQGALHQRVGQ